MNKALLKKTGRDLYGRKGSLAALVIIVAIGVGGFVCMAAVWRDLVRSRDAYYREYRINDFSVELESAPPWAIREAASLPNVKNARGRVRAGALIELPGRNEPVSGAAISMPEIRRPVINDLLLKKGVWFSGKRHDEAILNDAFAEANGLKPGDRIRILLPDKRHDVLVVGTAMSPEYVYLIPEGGGLAPDPSRFGVVYFTEDFLQEACDLDGAYNQLVGTVHDSSDGALDATLAAIERRLDPYGVTMTTPASRQPSIRFLDDELNGIRVSSRVMPTIFLLVGALVLNILLSRMVAQQRSVIGALKALGYGSGAITRHYLGYGLVVGAAGGVCGLLLGGWLQGVLMNMYRGFFALPDMRARFYWDVYAGGFFISVAFALAGTLKGVRYAAKLEPAEAMRPPPPEKGGRIFLQRIGFFWKPLPFRWKMILRAVFRNPFRSGVSVLAAMISMALIMTALNNMASLDFLMKYQFRKIARQDITASLRDPKGRGVRREIEDMPTIAGAEPQLTVSCDLKNGPYERRAGVIGVVENNRLFTPLDARGRPLIIPEKGLVLSEKLAELLNVEPGDVIRVRPLIGERRAGRVPVAAVSKSYLGLSAYADFSYLNRLIGEEWSANVVLGRSFRGRGHDELYQALKESRSVVGVGERIRSLNQIRESFGDTLGASLGVMIFFAGMIAFGSVLNTALVSLSERRREVGTLRVLGYTPGQAARIFSGESLLLNAAGICLGICLGAAFSHFLARAYSTELYRFPAIIHWPEVGLAVALMILFVALAQVVIYRMIVKLDWLEVLKVKE